MDAGFPMNIKDVFGIPSNVDAAFVWPRNNNIYFFKDSKYWAYNPHSNPGLDPTSPQSISQWGGLPSNLEAALQHTNGKSYFFHSGHYYRLDDDTRAVDQITSQAFPRPTGFWWFGCEQNSVSLMEAGSMKGDVFG